MATIELIPDLAPGALQLAPGLHLASIIQEFSLIKTKLIELEKILKAEHVKAEHVKAEHVKAEHVKAEHVKAEHVKAEHVKAEPVKKQPVAKQVDSIPEPISDEMCIFMKLPTGSVTTRASVLNYILQYIRLNKLQDFTQRKRILPDEPLRNILRLRIPDDELTFFNLHRYIENVL
jgi:chromatin remodeling complex protein RSC6